jgi:regulator of replication initiation timing
MNANPIMNFRDWSNLRKHPKSELVQEIQHLQIENYELKKLLHDIMRNIGEILGRESDADKRPQQ